MTTARKVRFTHRDPCPICGGGDDLPRGAGVRCYGFLSSDGDYAHCSREDYAGQLQRDPNCITFPQRLVSWRCGIGHDSDRRTITPP